MQVTEFNFDKLISNSLPVMIYFYAGWCGPCTKTMNNLVDELIVDFDGKIVVGKINIDECPKLCIKLDVKNIPAILFFSDGIAVERKFGVIKKEQLISIIKELINKSNVTTIKRLVNCPHCKNPFTQRNNSTCEWCGNNLF